MIAAIVAGRWAKGLFGIEKDRQDQADEDRKALRIEQRQAQAGKVAVWWETTEAGGSNFLIGNFSESPVFDVTARAGVLDGEKRYTQAESPIQRWAVLAPLPAGQRAGGYTVPMDELINAVTDGQARRSGTVEFTDGAGVMWLRDGRGDLHELGLRQPPGIDYAKNLTDSA